MNRRTISELAWPMDADSHQQAQEWAASIAIQVLDWTWRAFDALHANVLRRIDLNQPLDQVERDLTSNHFQEIQRIWAIETEGYASLTPQHEQPEMATRSSAPAKPPAYDIAFIWNDNRRVAWPFEAKVVANPAKLAEYLKDTAKFTNGTAAPFVGEGAQVAYLLSGIETDFFAKLSTRLQVDLQVLPEFVGRAHRSSGHARRSAPDLRLHHLAMLCSLEQKETMLPGF